MLEIRASGTLFIITVNVLVVFLACVLQMGEATLVPLTRAMLSKTVMANEQGEQHTIYYGE